MNSIVAEEISAAVLVGFRNSQPACPANYGSRFGPIGPTTKEKIGRAVGQLMDCNQAGNQSGGV